MQSSTSPSSPIWEAVKSFGPIGTFITGIAVLIGTLWNRKKKGKERAETNLDIANASDKIGRLALDTIKRLGMMQDDAAYLKSRLTYQTTMETIARNRTHRMTGAYSTAVLVIREREELLRCIAAKLKEENITLNIDMSFDAYKVKTQEEIFGDEDLPLPPDDRSR